MNVVDTSGWLEFFADSVNAKNFIHPISAIDSLIVPAIVIYEVFKKISRDFDEDKALIAIAHMKQAKVVDMDETIAIHAAKISNEKKIPMADSIIYATATIYNATVYTQDDDFKELKGVKYFAKKSK
jgi:toxin FitB